MAYKVAYLFGAGATHAEVMNSTENADEAFREKYGLLISHVSKRVIKKVNESVPWMRDHEDIFASRKGTFNIELLISLFENNRVPDHVIRKLKNAVHDDIKDVLSDNRIRKFYLHNALLELHQKINEKEELIGTISLNYDTVLDDAYKRNDFVPHYCLSSENREGIPLLKLHGSFDWVNGVSIDGRRRPIDIIPIGMNKNYLFPPYNFVWAKAYELLKRCDVLRIIGCSLSQTDLGLIDLLFKSHSDKGSGIKLKVIDFQPQNGYHSIKTNYGFFPNIIEPNPPQERVNLNDPEELLIADIQMSDYENGNPFKIWLKAKALSIFSESEIESTKYLKKCF